MDTEKTQFGNGQGNSPPEEKKPIIVYQFPLPAFLMREKSKRRGHEQLQKCVLVRAPEKRQQLKKSEGQS